MPIKIKKILIANRGEIACRIINTAKKMGIATVAVYSDADKDALHTKNADEAIYIGASPALESYLNVKKILNAVQESGADAVHPGYGFLSENPDFVAALTRKKITFIGPSAKSMRAMGLKDAAKKIMARAGVPITPGYHGAKQSAAYLKIQAKNIGYPILIKAVAGGGGKGMRKVTKPSDFTQSLESCRREAKSSFGDGRVLLEKYIEAPRHIEVQIFGDTHGNIIHLFERDCSLQRRYQKVIEEAPATGMTDAMRTAMTQAAIKAARAVNYVGAGTVEFIVDARKKMRTDGFWFMEMNTRLQVEHPITEEITGLDLVELQIRVANGERLPPQNSIKINGHAIEARLYSEDPMNDFAPSIGRLDIFHYPKNIHADIGGRLDIFQYPQNIRADIGVTQSDIVSPFYDPMIGKIIIHAKNRAEAVAGLTEACKRVAIYPIKNNVRFLTQCLAHKKFRAGDFTTHFIDQNIKTLSGDRFAQDKTHIAHAISPKRADGLFGDISTWRLNSQTSGEHHRFYQGEEVTFSLMQSGQNNDGHQKEKAVSLFNRAEGDVVFVDGTAYLLEHNIQKKSDSVSDKDLTAPVPGTIVGVKVKLGARVKVGDPLLILESMKMETVLTAPRSGIIARLNVKIGTLVSGGDVLLEMKEGK